MGLESISEPDDMDMDDDDDENRAEREEDEEEGADEPFFDTREDGEDVRSPSTSPDASVRGGAGASTGTTKSEDFDTEEDPMGPITPRTTFDAGTRSGVVIGSGVGKKDGKREGVRRVFDEDRGEEVVVDDDGDDDDDEDWVDPSLPTPIEPLPSKIRAPTMVQTHSNGSTSSSSSSGVKVNSSSSNKSKKSLKRMSAPLPYIRNPEPPLSGGHFPFPSSVEDTPQQEDYYHEDQWERDQSPPQQQQQQLENGAKLQRMHTARARDGGRTQSGGVKGVLTEDSGGGGRGESNI
jgi:cysteine protease ATG4